MTGSKRRIVAFITALAMAITMAFSVIFVVHEAEHECSHVDCQICAHINTCLNFFKNTTPKPEIVTVFLACAFLLILTLGVCCVGSSKKTLIDLKIKLSN